jgi:hypothetical protein
VKRKSITPDTTGGSPTISATEPLEFLISNLARFLITYPAKMSQRSTEELRLCANGSPMDPRVYAAIVDEHVSVF